MIMLETLSQNMLPIALFCLLVLGGTATVYAMSEKAHKRKVMRARMRVDMPDESISGKPVKTERALDERDLAASAAKKAQEFYASADPNNVVKLRQQLMQAGYLDPSAVGTYFLSRFIMLGVGSVLALASVFVFEMSLLNIDTYMVIVGGAGFGYMAPTLYLGQMCKKRISEYRSGFPDFMDLMIVCSDAGLSVEAAIDRVAHEISKSYPALSQNLILVTLELRAGRSIDEALRALADRLNVDEVRSFATLIKQSKELGTSLSGTLKVFSEEMRHKRMSVAEEKAHSLPAKMTIPVTMCILPTVLLIAVIPTIVKYSIQ